MATAAAVIAVTSCGGDGSGEGATTTSSPGPPAGAGCGQVEVDPLDPGSAQHLLPGAPPPTYATDPPTSGPHESGQPVTGAQAGPLAGPVQVTVLEVGGIVIQYRPDVPPDDRSKLVGLAGQKVVVAPNPTLPARVVATAWRHRLACRSVDLAALRAFISTRTDKGPG